MEYLNEEETIWAGEGADGGVHADGSGEIDRTINASLFVNEGAEELTVKGDVNGNVFVDGGANVEIEGTVRGNVHVEESVAKIHEDVEGDVYGISNVIVLGKLSGKGY